VNLAEITRDQLLLERQEVSLVHAAQAAGGSIEHQSDADLRGVLGIETR
jgi:hypothetical protein